jgi:solute:Na+ symporter, SSS family
VQIVLKITGGLALILYSYAIMVSGFFVPVIAGLFFDQRNPKPTGTSVMSGGALIAVLTI